jgi:predicted Rossmann fold nucleotide-binding protein DprA/Smf involved in DNA uptake
MESEQRNLVAADGLSQTEKRTYELLSGEEPRHIDDIMETTGLNSSEVLATLFELEMKSSGNCRGAVHKGLIVRGEDEPPKRLMHRKEADAHQETVR